jgi:Mannosyl-glycoprotein endo-beta-N-acetylglucosaminidase
MRNKAIALLLAALLLAAYYVNQQAKPGQARAAVQSSSVATSSIALVNHARTAEQQHSVLGVPTISAARIDGILCSYNPNVCGTGQALYDEGKKYGINPAYALAFFKHESLYGLYGVAASNKGLGNIRCTPGYECLHGFRKYASWSAGYEDWYKLISSLYVGTMHKSTVEAIIPTYAPSVENNVHAYITAVCSAVQDYQAKG